MDIQPPNHHDSKVHTLASRKIGWSCSFSPSIRRCGKLSLMVHSKWRKRMENGLKRKKRRYNLMLMQRTSCTTL
ncbi:hypothetical protein LINGRAHAP2_LOCUS34896, partial [Linum grandiflorum]